MQDRYDWRGRLLDEPDDPEWLYRCDYCGTEEHSYTLPKGWAETHIGPRASRYTMACAGCSARLRLEG